MRSIHCVKGGAKKVHLTSLPFLIVVLRYKLGSYIHICAELDVLQNSCLIEIKKNALIRAPLLWGGGLPGLQDFLDSSKTAAKFDVKHPVPTLFSINFRKSVHKYLRNWHFNNVLFRHFDQKKTANV